MAAEIGIRKRKAVWDKTNGRCYYCGVELVWKKQGVVYKEKVARRFVVDHARPKVLNGSNDLENLLPACWICNCKKGGKSLAEYRYYISMCEMGITPFTDDQIRYLEDTCGVSLLIPAVTFWAEQS